MIEKKRPYFLLGGNEKSTFFTFFWPTFQQISRQKLVFLSTFLDLFWNKFGTHLIRNWKQNAMFLFIVFWTFLEISDFLNNFWAEINAQTDFLINFFGSIWLEIENNLKIYDQLLRDFQLFEPLLSRNQGANWFFSQLFGAFLKQFLEIKNKSLVLEFFEFFFDCTYFPGSTIAMVIYIPGKYFIFFFVFLVFSKKERKSPKVGLPGFGCTSPGESQQACD